MGSDARKSNIRVPLVPLPKGTVLLPGVTLRIPVANRPDILALLLQRNPSNSRDPSVITLGCVPLQSPRLSKDGQQLLENGPSVDTNAEEFEAVDASQVRKDDLFRYGTVAKVIGLQRRAYAEPYLLVEGLYRFSITKVLKERPYFEADISIHHDLSMFYYLIVDNYNPSHHCRLTQCQ
jgi:ATP-dependent Lon protease